MALPEWENKFTIGNLITIVIGIVGVVYQYNQTTNELVRQGDRITTLEQLARERGAQRDADSARKDVRITALEIGQAGTSSDLRNIQVGINDIKTSIMQLSQMAPKVPSP